MKNKKAIIAISSIVVVLTALYITFKYFQRKEARKILAIKVVAQSQLNLEKAFNPDRWRNGNPKISDKSARDMADKIRNSIGWFTEDEDKINKAFYGIQNYDDLSVLSYQYKQKYNADLNQVLKNAYHGDNVKYARLRSIIASKINMK